jgi:hypothetical protein
MCRIGRDSECKLHGCAFELFGDVNCKDYIEKPILPVFKTPIKKVKQKNKVKRSKPSSPIQENHIKKTEYVYNRSNGICYICGDSIIKDEFRIFHTIAITYSHKYNKRTGKCDSILRARHKKCNINN